MKVAFGNDHAGLTMRQILLDELRGRGIEVIDLGARSEASVDYPDIAEKVCQAVAAGQADRGVLVCGTGVGISIAANKIDGIRCGLCIDEYSAVMSRRHNNANVIAMRGREFAPEENRRLLGIWLDTPFDGGERHERRIGKITSLEEYKG
ncbi:MAG: ribose 5-phosphate isomerase B [bacterium]|nr:ribose 5-phosphate isomerase B [bacterium]